MDWFFDHLQIVIFIVVGIIYALRTLGRQHEVGGDREATRPDSGDDESAEAERTRRIQEEIRRRILARQRGDAPPASVPGRMSDTPAGRRSFPRPAEESARPIPPPVPRVQRSPAAPVLPQVDESMLRHQRELQEKLAAIRAASANRPRMVGELSGRSATTARIVRPAQTNDRAQRLRRRLVGKRSIREAVLLREIIGPPVGMKSLAAGKSNLA